MRRRPFGRLRVLRSPEEHQQYPIHHAGGEAEDQHRAGDDEPESAIVNIFTIVPVMSPSAGVKQNTKIAIIWAISLESVLSIDLAA